MNDDARADTTLGDLARLVGGQVHGDPSRVIRAVRSLAAAGPGDIGFLTQERRRAEAGASRAEALLVSAVDPSLPQAQLVCAEVGRALVQILERFHPRARPAPGVHPTAVVDPTAAVDPSAHLGPHVVVGAGSRVEAGAALLAGVVVGRDCRVGAGSLQHPRVVLYDDTELGERVEVHAGAVLGADGFGYLPHAGRMVKVPPVGRLVVEDDVEIGANTCIDRAALEETRVGARSKLDNLVQVGHNVRFGPDCVVCGQVGIAGSAEIGRGVVLGGRSGVADHVVVGDGVQVAATSVVMQEVPAGRQVGGIPAVELAEWRRRTALLGRLRELFRRVRALERGLEEDSRDD